MIRSALHSRFVGGTVLGLLILAGCSRQASQPAPAPTEDPSRLVGKITTTDPTPGKTQDPPRPPAKETISEAPLLSAVELTRELSKDANAEQKYQNKVVRIEGLVKEVSFLLDPDKNGDAEVIMQGATDDPDPKKHLRLTFTIRDRPGAAKLGGDQKVILQGTFTTKINNSVFVDNVKVVAAGPIAFTQFEIERMRKEEEPKAVAALEKLGFNLNKSGSGDPTYDIQLTDKDLTTEGLIKPEVLVPMTQVVGFTTLNLYDTKVSDAGLAALKKMPHLRSITLYRTKIGDDGLGHLKDVRGLRWLKISFGGDEANSSPVTDAGLAHLKGMKGLADPEKDSGLQLGGSRITDAGLAHLADRVGLWSLTLPMNKITDTGLIHLRNMRNLHMLDLSRTQITGTGFVHLKGLGQLSELDLSNCPVVDAGLEPMAAFPGLSKLYLKNTKVGDAGLAHLSRAPKLQHLDLAGTDVGDAGIAHLGMVKTLKSLNLPRTKVTPEGINKLKAALPTLKVYTTGD